MCRRTCKCFIALSKVQQGNLKAESCSCGLLRDFPEADEHFREFDSNVLRPVMNAQVSRYLGKKCVDCLLMLKHKPVKRGVCFIRWILSRSLNRDQRTPHWICVRMLGGRWCSLISREALLEFSTMDLVPSRSAASEVRLPCGCAPNSHVFKICCIKLAGWHF